MTKAETGSGKGKEGRGKKEKERKEVFGISFIRRNEALTTSFVYDFQGIGEGFHLTSSIVDVSGLVKKGGEVEKRFREQFRAPFGETFIPDAAITEGKSSPTYSVSFDLKKAANTVSIENPDIQLTTLSNVVIRQFQEVRKMMTEGQIHPHFAQLFSLGRYLADKKGDNISQLTDLDFLRLLQKNMRDVTHESIALYCKQNNIPVIFKYRDPDSPRSKFTTEPALGEDLWLEAARPLEDLVSMANGTNIVAHLIGEDPRYPKREMDDLAELLNGETYFKILKKTAGKAKMAREISGLQPAQIESMPPKEFHDVVRSVFIDRLNPSNFTRNIIQNELILRMREGLADVRDYYDILFSMEEATDGYSTLRKRAVAGLYMNPAVAHNVITRFAQGNNRNGIVHYREKEVDDKRMYDSCVTFTIDDQEITSDAFTSPNQLESENHAKANAISKIIGISPDIDRELQAEASTMTMLPANEKERIITDGSTKSLEQVINSHPEGSRIEKLRKFCRDNGIEIVSIESSYNPDVTKTSHGNRIVVKIGDLFFQTETHDTTPRKAEGRAAVKMLNQLTNRREDLTIFPTNLQSEITRITNFLNLPKPQMSLHHTTTPQGERLAYCVITGGKSLSCIGSGTDDQEAILEAQKKFYIIMKKDEQKNS